LEPGLIDRPAQRSVSHSINKSAWFANQPMDQVDTVFLNWIAPLLGFSEAPATRSEAIFSDVNWFSPRQTPAKRLHRMRLAVFPFRLFPFPPFLLVPAFPSRAPSFTQ